MADCKYTVGDLDASGDNLYGTRMANQPFIDWAWHTWQFAYSWWQDGWGYDDCTNRRKPLARTFAALYVLTYSTTNNWSATFGPNMLEWGARWAAGQIQGYELRARCGTAVASTTGQQCAAGHNASRRVCDNVEQQARRECRSWFFLFSWICQLFVTIWVWVCTAWSTITTWICDAFTAKHVDLQNTPYFYGKPVVGRASTFIHECRHISGKPHNANFPPGSVYGTGSGADSDWEYEGAWRWQAIWLAWYAETAINSTAALRTRARDDANVIVLGAFAKSPGFTF